MTYYLAFKSPSVFPHPLFSPSFQASPYMGAALPQIAAYPAPGAAAAAYLSQAANGQIMPLIHPADQAAALAQAAAAHQQAAAASQAAAVANNQANSMNTAVNGASNQQQQQAANSPQAAAAAMAQHQAAVAAAAVAHHQQQQQQQQQQVHAVQQQHHMKPRSDRIEVSVHLPSLYINSVKGDYLLTTSSGILHQITLYLYRLCPHHHNPFSTSSRDSVRL